ncbi:glycosyl hydrolase family 17 protein [Bradyrhizobium sp. NP1]|uniref:glycoside hydrolase family 17 protein n=1 Tax=Bradyrhizobium sp. NP1 TaxID=3049772 RepID=UPI0025A51401|nr:glycosyl hydrolase family 17 protein [Bradyrhizobium sp. NP1]WJR76744.1 glycosyl hydrolase family 17 protein [Bradyrhizobium sp. NP1]
MARDSCGTGKADKPSPHGSSANPAAIDVAVRDAPGGWKPRTAAFTSVRETANALCRPFALLLVSLAIIAAVWWWLALPVTLVSAPIDPTKKLDCVSYAPFRYRQSPWNSRIIISPEQIAEDLADLAKISRCIRIYSVENGLDKVPELASKAGLKVILGVWIGRDHLKNALLIDSAVLQAKGYPGVVTAIIVGSEVLLRGEMTASQLRETIRSVKARVTIPVSYADAWEFWLRYPEVGSDVDFVTIHVLPYWEDLPVRAEDAAAHVDDVRKKMVLAFPGKEILIGETGWPSRGRMRKSAVPSRINQARFTSEVLDLARREDFRVNLFEAYDEPWKRQWEGTVGAHWGLFDAGTRGLKYSPGLAVSNYPFWKVQLVAGLAFGISVFVAAWLTLRLRLLAAGVAARWLAVATSATVGGILLGLSAEKMLCESYGFAGWLVQGLLLAVGIAAPFLCSNALMSGRPLPTLLEWFGPSDGRTRSLPTRILGFMFTVTTLVAAETAFVLVFDPRSRDFPFAGLTMAVVPIWTLTQLNPRKSEIRPFTEAMFAGLFLAAALYIAFNEGVRNWQSLWTSVMYFVLGTTLWPTRSVVVLSTLSSMPVVLWKMFGRERRALQPINVALVPELESSTGTASRSLRGNHPIKGRAR